MENWPGAIVFATLMVLLYGSARLWVYSVDRWVRGEAVVPFEPRRPVPWGLIDLLLMFLLTILFVTLAQRLAVAYGKIPLDAGLAAFKPHELALLMLASSGATLASCLAAMLLAKLRAGGTLRDLGLVAAEFASDVKLGATAFVMLAPPMYLLQIALTQIWEYEHPVQDLLEQQTDVTMLLVTLITAVVVAPFAEEIFFRVLFQGWLENVSALLRKALGLSGMPADVASDNAQRDWRAVLLGDRSGAALLESAEPPGESLIATPVVASELPSPVVDDGNPYASPQADTSTFIESAAPAAEKPAPTKSVFRPGYVPIFISAAIFALMHLGQGPAPIPLFFLAIGLGYLYRQTHRATPSIVVHLLINSVSMAIFWFSLVYKE